MSVPIPPQVKSAVGFIFIKDKIEKLVPCGTAFFVGVRNPSDPDVNSCYLVTAKHVLYGPNTKKFRDEVFVRLNKKVGCPEYVNIPIKSNNQTVFTHKEDVVDIAVIPFEPDEDKFDFKFIPDDMVTTKQAYNELNISEGSDVFFTGLFVQYFGGEKNYPVVRFGRVALVTDEKIEWDGKQMDLYLIEAGSYSGNSGSPVFFYLGSDRIPGCQILGLPVLRLAGVMKGAVKDKVVETKKEPNTFYSRIGIVAVVPSYKLHEILFSDELKKHRGF
jgi:hypothetical protein